MTHNTATQEGRQQRLEAMAKPYFESGNKRGLTRLLGLSPSDWDESPIDGGSHPDERYR
jgi:hypothetical protein